MDLSDIEISFDYGGDSESERREIVRNVQTIMTTPIGTCPLYRDFGLDVSALDYPPGHSAKPDRRSGDRSNRKMGTPCDREGPDLPAGHIGAAESKGGDFQWMNF